MTEGWICEGGHPYYLIDGVKVCWVCEQIKEYGPRKSGCKKKLHTNPLGGKNCITCEKHRKRPWQKELDENGTALCPEGHTVTHESLKYSLSACGAPQRKCSVCSEAAANRANNAYTHIRAKAREAKGLPPRRPQEKVRLPIDFFDWVVALRLIEGKIDEVYEMTRGSHVGPTAMEKWVAYNSTTDDSVFTRRFSNSIKSVRWQWAETGAANGWPPKTLAQAMAEL